MGNQAVYKTCLIVKGKQGWNIQPLRAMGHAVAAGGTGKHIQHTVGSLKYGSHLFLIQRPVLCKGGDIFLKLVSV